jgi:hypothetical protein
MRGGALEQGGKWPEARAALREAYRPGARGAAGAELSRLRPARSR